MAIYLFHHLFSFLFFLLLLSSLNCAHSSSFSFIKNLEGSHKGSKAEGVIKLKQYLEKFGYLQYAHKAHHAKDDYFDATLVSAIKTYQKNFHLKQTGTLDAETVAAMTKARCGVADIINGTNHMAREEWDHKNSGIFRTVGRYTYPPGYPRWPQSKTQIRYVFITNFPPQYVSCVDRAYSNWAKVSRFTFVKVPYGAPADSFIGIFTGSHGDNAPFDGPGGTLAHAYYPTDGKLHFDGAERWSVGAVRNSYDFQTVAEHEIGHQLGLGHSQLRAALMWPSADIGTTKGIHQDDIDGVRNLYR